MNGLTTHVLDLAKGAPAAGVLISLSKLEHGAPRHLLEAVTNADGRIDNPLLAGAELVAGLYELAFHIGDYFGNGSAPAGAIRFLDVVPIRFGVEDPTLHYHVPLLVTPWSYSTYRGS